MPGFVNTSLGLLILWLLLCGDVATRTFVLSAEKILELAFESRLFVFLSGFSFLLFLKYYWYSKNPTGTCFGRCGYHQPLSGPKKYN